MHILTIDDLKEQENQSIESRRLRIGVYLNEKNIMQKFFFYILLLKRIIFHFLLLKKMKVSV